MNDTLFRLLISLVFALCVGGLTLVTNPAIAIAILTFCLVWDLTDPWGILVRLEDRAIEMRQEKALHQTFPEEQ